MKRVLLAAALSVVSAHFATGQTPDRQKKQAAKESAPAGAERAVTARVNEFFAALRKGDAAALGPFYADDYTLITETGAVGTRAQRLERLGGGDAAGLATVEPSDLSVRAYGDAAVVTGLVTITDGGTVIKERFT